MLFNFMDNRFIGTKLDLVNINMFCKILKLREAQAICLCFLLNISSNVRLIISVKWTERREMFNPVYLSIVKTEEW